MATRAPEGEEPAPVHKARPGSKQGGAGWSWKDAVTLPSSLAALLISGSGFYFNLVRLSDDIRMLIPTVPYVTLDNDHSRFAIEPAETILFMNSGNRSAAISFVQLYVNQDRNAQDGCELPSALMLEYDAEPFGLKPSEIASRTIQLKGKRPPEYKEDPLGIAGNGFITFPLTEENKNSETHWIQVCMSVQVLTPSTYQQVRAIELYRTEIDKKGEIIWDTWTNGNLINIPITLVQTRGTIFSGW